MSKAEDELEIILVRNNLLTYHREHMFHVPNPGEKQRRWRMDFAWVDEKLGLEVDGGAFSRGRHVRGAGFEKDAEKGNMAVEQGWRVLHYTPQMIRRDPEGVVATIWACLTNSLP